MDQPFRIVLGVRDYECDYHGIVNNAVYLNYLEHARHEYLKQMAIDVVALSHQGIFLVVVRTEIDYLWPLRSGDQFGVKVRLERISRLRFAFFQEIERQPEAKPIIKAKVIGTALDANRRPKLPPEIERLLEKGLPPG